MPGLDRGRPRKTWLRVVKNDKKELSLANLDALDHHAWKRKIEGHVLTQALPGAPLGFFPE